MQIIDELEQKTGDTEFIEGLRILVEYDQIVVTVSNKDISQANIF